MYPAVSLLHITHENTVPPHIARFQVLTVVSLKLSVFQDVTPCSLADRFRCCFKTFCLYIQMEVKIKLEAARFSETSETIYRTVMHTEDFMSFLSYIISFMEAEQGQKHRSSYDRIY
jgi:hypothetical protein